MNKEQEYNEMLSGLKETIEDSKQKIIQVIDDVLEMKHISEEVKNKLREYRKDPLNHPCEIDETLEQAVFDIQKEVEKWTEE